MTKSEAKAIQQRMGRAARILNGTHEPGAIQWAGMSSEQIQNVNDAIKAAREEVEAVLEMAGAELGLK